MYEVFEKLAQEKRVSVYKVSKETGIAQATFIDWKNGKYTPKVDKLQKIADFFEVSLNYLMTGEENEQNKSVASKIADDTKLKQFEDIVSQLSPERVDELLHFAQFLANRERDE